MNPIPTYNSSMFNWNKGRGFQDRSQFNETVAGQFGFIGKRPNSASNDIVFDVKSTRTGKISRFYYVHDEDGYDGEGEVYKNDLNHTITIFND